jgi:hypothetical protein
MMTPAAVVANNKQPPMIAAMTVTVTVANNSNSNQWPRRPIMVTGPPRLSTVQRSNGNGLMGLGPAERKINGDK